jgi:hypothetical protein
VRTNEDERKAFPTMPARIVAGLSAGILSVPYLIDVLVHLGATYQSQFSLGERASVVTSLALLLLVLPVAALAALHCLKPRPNRPWWPLVMMSVSIAAVALLREPQAIVLAQTREGSVVWSGSAGVVLSAAYLVLAMIQFVVGPRR